MTSVTSDDFDQHLELAMRTRPVIEQAKGVLAGFRCATPEQAFTELVRVSQTYNVKLSMLAEALVTVVGGHREADPGLVEIIDQEWGGLLPRC